MEMRYSGGFFPLKSSDRFVCDNMAGCALNVTEVQFKDKTCSEISGEDEVGDPSNCRWHL